MLLNFHRWQFIWGPTPEAVVVKKGRNALVSSLQTSQNILDGRKMVGTTVFLPDNTSRSNKRSNTHTQLPRPSLGHVVTPHSTTTMLDNNEFEPKEGVSAKWSSGGPLWHLAQADRTNGIPPQGQVERLFASSSQIKGVRHTTKGEGTFFAPS